MTGSRLSPMPLLYGHWKSLADVRIHRDRGDWLTRAALLAALGCLPIGWYLDWAIRAPQPILAGMSLLAGALVGSFGQVNTLRLKMTDRDGDEDPTAQVDRDAIDESAAHLLTAAFLCAVTAAVLVIGINTSPDPGPDPAVRGIWAAVASALGSYAMITFFIAVPRLYAAYVHVNQVSDDVSGYARRRRH